MSNDILATLAQVAKEFVAVMRDKLEEVNAPDNERQSIKNSIYIDSPKSGRNGSYSVDIRIPLKEAPAAGAWEWGSGEHDRRGEYPDGYLITGDPMLFPKGDWPGYQPPPPAPEVFKFFEVMHPGIKARPFIAPSIEKYLPEAKKKLAKELVASVLITGNTYSGRHYEVIIVGGGQ